MDTIGTVEDILKAKGNAVYAAAPDTTVYEAIRLLADRNVGALMVMEGDSLVGVFSERDYTRKVALQGKNSKETRVREVITGKVISITADTTVDTCMRLMIDHRIRHLPVVTDGRVAGVVSIGDLVNWIIKAQQAAISQLQDYIAGQYPG